jgi:hypothetical protein
VARPADAGSGKTVADEVRAGTGAAEADPAAEAKTGTSRAGKPGSGAGAKRLSARGTGATVAI